MQRLQSVYLCTRCNKENEYSTCIEIDSETRLCHNCYITRYMSND